MSLIPSRIKTLCFDVDGTLSDTDDEYAARIARWFRPLKWLLPHQDPHWFARWLVMAIEHPGNLAIGIPDRLGIDDELYRLGEKLRRNRPTQHHFRLIAGVHETLESLAPRFKMTVVTARGPRGTEAFLEQFGMRMYFVGIASSQTTPRAKPFPDPIYWSASLTGVQPHECLMIGDTPIDIRAGRAAGAQTVGVLSGFGSRKRLLAAGADAILPSVAELPALLG